MKLEDIEEMSAIQEVIYHKRGDIIYKSGDAPNYLYCIKSGTAKTTIAKNDGNGPITSLAFTGDMIGHRSVMLEQPHLETAVAMTDMDLCRFEAEVFRSMLRSVNEVSYELSRRLALYALEKEQHILKLTQKHLRERLADILLNLGQKAGFRTNGKTIDLEITRTDLSGIAGTTLESVSRKIGEFKREGLISTAGKTITIEDEEGLHRVSTFYDE